MKATYKLIDYDKSFEDYWGKKHIFFKMVDFETAREQKGISKQVLKKIGLTTKSTKRDLLFFPSKESICNWLGLPDDYYTKLFNSEGEAIASSQKSTIKYLLCVGLNPMDYGFNEYAANYAKYQNTDNNVNLKIAA